VQEDPQEVGEQMKTSDLFDVRWDFNKTDRASIKAWAQSALKFEFEQAKEWIGKRLGRFTVKDVKIYSLKSNERTDFDPDDGPPTEKKLDINNIQFIFNNVFNNEIDHDFHITFELSDGVSMHLDGRIFYIPHDHLFQDIGISYNVVSLDNGKVSVYVATETDKDLDRVITKFFPTLLKKFDNKLFQHADRGHKLLANLDPSGQLSNNLPHKRLAKIGREISALSKDLLLKHRPKEEISADLKKLIDQLQEFL
jgi:hypothetical protein